LQLDLSIFNPKARSLIGLDVSSSSVKMVELASDGKGGYRVERYAIEVLPRDVVSDGNIVNLEAAAESVRRAWKKLATSTRHVAIALPASHVITKKIIVAAGQREEELELLVESEANQYIPFALDEVNLDFQVVGPAPSSPDEIEVLIAASRKEKVEDRVAVAESAGLKPVVLDVESYAVLAAFELIEAQLPERGKGQIVALVDIGANVMNLTVLRNSQQLYVREQAFGGNQLTQDIARLFGMSFEEAETEKRRTICRKNTKRNCCGRFSRPWLWSCRGPCSSSSPRPSSTRSTILSWRGGVQSSLVPMKSLRPEHRSTPSLPIPLPRCCFPIGFAGRVWRQMRRH
jgi:type IV pilus assembly protein PilM